MKKSKTLALALILVASSTMSSCASTHLWNWGFDRSSYIDEPRTEFSAALIKPSLTLAFTPVTLAWDAVTLPMQLLFQVYPFFGAKHMAPAEVEVDN